ncbi:MAG: hypothetical protein KC621_33380 [Myxococcales bacterium]|nr:hypothetical protein [Myxococcales bacterium]
MPADQGPVTTCSLDVSCPRKDLVADWRRCGLSADYMAAFLARHLPDRFDAEIALSTIINELLECTVKFSLQRDQVVSLHATWADGRIRVETTQWSSAAQVRMLRGWLARLSSGDPEAVWLAHLEESARDRAHPSGLGLVALVKDYDAQLTLDVDEGMDPATNTAIFRVTLRALIPEERFVT